MAIRLSKLRRDELGGAVLSKLASEESLCDEGLLERFLNVSSATRLRNTLDVVLSDEEKEFEVCTSCEIRYLR